MNDELMHHGIKGQKHGVRRYQYKNGTLTPDDIKRYRKNKTAKALETHRTLISENEGEMKEKYDAKRAKAYKKNAKRYGDNKELHDLANKRSKAKYDYEEAFDNAAQANDRNKFTFNKALRNDRANVYKDRAKMAEAREKEFGKTNKEFKMAKKYKNKDVRAAAYKRDAAKQAYKNAQDDAVKYGNDMVYNKHGVPRSVNPLSYTKKNRAAQKVRDKRFDKANDVLTKSKKDYDASKKEFKETKIKTKYDRKRASNARAEYSSNKHKNQAYKDYYESDYNYREAKKLHGRKSDQAFEKRMAKTKANDRLDDVLDKSKHYSNDTSNYTNEYRRLRDKYETNKHNKSMTKSDLRELKRQKFDAEDDMNLSKRYDTISKQPKGRERKALEARYKKKGYSDRDAALKADYFIDAQNDAVSGMLLGKSKYRVPHDIGVYSKYRALDTAADNLFDWNVLDSPKRSRRSRSTVRHSGYTVYSDELCHSEYFVYSDELYHHGRIGQKWGVRRFQNKDGTLTPAGKKRYAKLDSKLQSNTDKIRKTSYDNDAKLNKAYQDHQIARQAYKTSKKKDRLTRGLLGGASEETKAFKKASKDASNEIDVQINNKQREIATERERSRRAAAFKNSSEMDQYVTVYNNVADKMNNGMIKKYNDKFDKDHPGEWWKDPELNQKYEDGFREMENKEMYLEYQRLLNGGEINPNKKK